MRSTRIGALGRIEKSYEIADAGLLAMKLAFDRKKKSIGLEEYFSGIYLADPAGLLPYWRDRKSLCVFVREYCGLHQPLWFYWIDAYMSFRNDRAWRAGRALHYSHPVATMLDEAARLAIRSAKKSGTKVELRVDHFLMVLAAHQGLQFSRKAVASGMNLQALVSSISD